MRLREIREAVGMSRRSLAASAGVSMREIEGIEAGKRDPRVSTAKKLAEALGGIPLDELCAPAAGRPKAPGTSAAAALIEDAMGYKGWAYLKDLRALAEREHIAEHTLRRARAKLRVRGASVGRGADAVCVWYLEGTPDEAVHEALEGGRRL
jgi:transcriptional regulator with XRE-family HTH domain